MTIRFVTRTISHFLLRNPPTPKSNPTFSFISRNFSQISQYRERILLANLLQRYGFPPSNLPQFIQNNPFLLNFNLPQVEKCLGILLSLKLSQNSIVSILSTCPQVLEFGFLKKWENGFSELGPLPVSPLLLQNVLQHSAKLYIEPIDLITSLRTLRDLGFTRQTVTKVVEGFPRVVKMKSRDVEERVQFFKWLGIPWGEIDGMCCSFPGVLGFGVEGRLRPLVNEFGSLGFTLDEVREEIVKNPWILRMEIGELSRCLQLLGGLKCRFAIEEKIRGKGALSAGFEVKLRVDCLCKHGMIRREAFKVVYREPRVILYDLEDIEKKIEFLKEKMGFEIGCLIEVPEYLGVNFEKQIVLRFNVLEFLRSKGGLGSKVGLRGMIKPSRLRFYNLYVKPYPECEKIYGRFSRDDEVRHQRPVGLWKMFKPPSYPETKEDLENMKLFMGSG